MRRFGSRVLLWARRRRECRLHSDAGAKSTRRALLLVVRGERVQAGRRGARIQARAVALNGSTSPGRITAWLSSATRARGASDGVARGPGYRIASLRRLSPEGVVMGKRSCSVGRAALVAGVVVAAGQSAVAQADTRVTRDATPGSYVRYDGGTDATMLSCGTGRRTQNEPSVAVDPRNAASSSPARTTTARRSRTVRATCGPATTARPTAAPLVQQPRAGLSRRRARLRVRRRRRTAVRRRRATRPSPSTAPGRLYYGFICFNRAKPTNGSIYVARYDADGASYVRTVRVERGTPSVWGLFQDKINVAVDQSAALGERLCALGPLPGPGRQQLDPFRALHRQRADFSKPLYG